MYVMLLDSLKLWLLFSKVMYGEAWKVRLFIMYN